MTGEPDTFGALLALVTAAALSDTRDPSPAAVHALAFGAPRTMRRDGLAALQADEPAPKVSRARRTWEHLRSFLRR
jgi:hypothetical protein